MKTEKCSDLKAITVGGGFVRNHAQTLVENGIPIVGTVGGKLETAKRMREDFGRKATSVHTDIDDALALHNDQDGRKLIVVGAVPPDKTLLIARSMVEAKVAGLLEKPFGTGYDLEEAKEIVADAQANNVDTALGYHWEYAEIDKRLRHRIAASPVVKFEGGWHGSMPPEEVKWWRNEEQSGGQLNEQASHITRRVLRDLGPAMVIDASEKYYAHKMYPDQTVADESQMTLRIQGTQIKGTVSASCRRDREIPPTVYVKYWHTDGSVSTLTRQELRVKHPGKDPEVYEYQHPAKKMLGHFLEVASGESKKPPRSTFQEGVAVQQLVYDAKELMRTNAAA